jgi:hypothetical protein
MASLQDIVPPHSCCHSRPVFGSDQTGVFTSPDWGMFTALFVGFSEFLVDIFYE